jgi:hypothetical protein
MPPNENTGPQRQTTAFVIILDAETSAYLAQVAGANAHQYLVQLLRAEQQRYATRPASDRATSERIEETIADTPDTSGYPQMTEHFRTLDLM